MLTSDLVRARLWKGEVRPQYLPEDSEHLQLAATLIELFERHQGQPRHELEAELAELLGTGTAFLLHRGLAKLLFDRCEFDPGTEQEPAELREAVFRAAAEAYRRPAAEERGEAGFRFEREAVIAAACGGLELAPEAFERTLYADLKDQQLLRSFEPCDATWLVRRYNTALAQAVLLRARSLELHIAGQSAVQYRALLRKIKFFQLLHRVHGDQRQGYHIVLDGPLSLFKASQRYGLQMASFLPTLLHFRGWQLEASVLWGLRRKAATLRLSAQDGLSSYTRLTGQWQPEELSWLPEQFAKLESAWQVSTEAELVDLGGQGVLVPDFVFEHPPTGTRVLMEVFGFWNRGAVESRLALLRRHGSEKLLLAVSKSLLADREVPADLAAEIYVFRAHPIARQVLSRLEELLPQ